MLLAEVRLREVNGNLANALVDLHVPEGFVFDLFTFGNRAFVSVGCSELANEQTDIKLV